MIDYDSFSRCHLTDIFFAFHAGAKELKNGMALLNPSSLVQISMDGPKVKWKFHHNIFQENHVKNSQTC